LLWPRRKRNYKETNTFQNGIERGQMNLVVMKIKIRHLGKDFLMKEA